MNGAFASLHGAERKFALASMAMNFSEPDNAPGELLNRVVWHSVQGCDTPYPRWRRRRASRRSKESPRAALSRLYRSTTAAFIGIRPNAIERVIAGAAVARTAAFTHVTIVFGARQ